MEARKIAIVTGASRGIGAEIARRLASDGFAIGIHHGRGVEQASKVRESIEAGGGEAFTFGADLAAADAAQRFFGELDAALESRYGSFHFDVLVNNAGISPLADIRSTTPEQFDEIFAINVRAAFFLARGAMERIRDGGRIVNLSSALTRVTVSQTAAYSMSKAAINTLTRLLAVDLGPRGVCVNAVAPGVTVTEMSADLLSRPGVANATMRANAIARLGETRDVAAVVSFLAGADSGWVTGQVIEASGGTRL